MENLTWERYAENPKIKYDSGTALTIYLRTSKDDVTEFTMPRPVTTIKYEIIKAPKESLPAQAEAGKVYSQTRTVRAK